MKHATPAAIARLEPLVAELRELAPLREPKPGRYCGSKALLQLREGGNWERSRVDTQRVRAALLSRVWELLAC